MDFLTMSTEARLAHFESLSPEDLAAAHESLTSTLTASLAVEAPTIDQVNEAQVAFDSRKQIEGVQAERAAAATEAAERLAAMRTEFSVNSGVESGEGESGDEGDGTDEGGDEGENADANAESGEGESGEGDGGESGEGDGGEGDGGEATVTASARHIGAQTVRAPKRTSAARKVGQGAARPARADASPIVITAGADVPEFSLGQKLAGMGDVAQGLLNRVQNFPHFDVDAAARVRDIHGPEHLTKVGLAKVGVNFDPSLVASASGEGADYGTVQAAIKQHSEAMERSMTAALKGEDPTLSAAGWCAPSEQTYSFIADYVVDGLLSLPEVSAPRGGLWITTGPALQDSLGMHGENFGFVQTEAQAEAGTVKPCETIVCPEFEDHRLDAVGYCWKIPLLTQAAYPELVTDALRLSNVLFAHKLNSRYITDLVAMSSAMTFDALGATFTDSLEALSIIATKERRRWNVGERAIMEVKLPVIAREIFRADMSRRTGLALSDVATDAKIAAEFATRRLSVEYLADWQDTPLPAGAGAVARPASVTAMIYPAGTFVRAVKPVINIQGVYDAASLSINEYTGVFFEQGIMTAKVGYGSRLIAIPTNTAGLTGAPILDNHPESANWAGQKAAVVA